MFSDWYIRETSNPLSRVMENFSIRELNYVSPLGLAMPDYIMEYVSECDGVTQKEFQSLDDVLEVHAFKLFKIDLTYKWYFEESNILKMLACHLIFNKYTSSESHSNCVNSLRIHIIFAFIYYCGFKKGVWNIMEKYNGQM